MFQWRRYKLFLVFLHVSSLFCGFAFRKDEFSVEILVKGDGSGERLALFARETIERFCFAFGEQVRDVCIGKQLACHLLEHWHSTLLVAASDNLSEELHRALLALWTLAARLLVTE